MDGLADEILAQDFAVDEGGVKGDTMWHLNVVKALQGLFVGSL